MGHGVAGRKPGINLGSRAHQLIRGPSSGLDGTGAMFAVINIVSKEGQAMSGAQDTPKTGNLGRNEHGVAAGTALENAALSPSPPCTNTWTATLASSSGIQRPGHQQWDRQNLDWISRTGVQLSGTLGSFSLRASDSYRERSDPTGSYGVLFNAPDHFVDRFQFVELANVSALSSTKLLASRVYYDDILYNGTYPLPSGGAFHQTAVNRVLGAEASLRWDLAARDRLTLGAEYRRYVESRLSSPDDPTYRGRRPFSVGSLFLQNEFQLTSNLTLQAGVRHDQHQIAGGATTPRAALLYDPWKGTTFKLMYGEPSGRRRSTRPPSSRPPSAGSSSSEKLRCGRRSGSRAWEDNLPSAARSSYRVCELINAVQLYEYVNLDNVEAKGIEVSLEMRGPRREPTGTSTTPFSTPGCPGLP